MHSKIKSISTILLILCLAVSLNSCGKKEKTSVKVDMEKAISVSKLNTVKFSYDGIADKMIGGETYHISYEGSVKLGVDLDKVVVSKDGKTITLPKLAIQSISVSPGKYKYLPENPDINVKKAAEICEKDLEAEVNSNSELWETAKNNTEQKIRNLVKSYIEEDITFEWEEG